MDNEKMDTPPITSFVVDNKPGNYRRQKPPPWNAPSKELLSLLKFVDDSQPTSNQRFCFQPSRDLSEISRAFLSVSSSDLQYDIDLKTIRFIGSDAVPPAVAKLQEYANDVLRKIQRFRDCLLEHDVIDDPTCFLRVDMLTCPVCLKPLVSCFECGDKTACSDAKCLASLVVDCEQCFVHDRMACRDCLKKNDTVPPLVPCPVCQIWCCREDLLWCAGLVVQPTLGSKELDKLFHQCGWDNDTIVRSHPPKPSPCISHQHGVGPSLSWRLCYNGGWDGVPSPNRCPSQAPFITNHRLRNAFCPECLEKSSGRKCACGLVWLCDVCFVIKNKSVDYPHTITCPRCGVSYCRYPNSACQGHIDLCMGCKGAILCKDCREEEELPGDVQTRPETPKVVVFTEQCGFCDVWVCGDCSTAKGTGRCAHCGDWFCDSCTAEVTDLFLPCALCYMLVCRECRMDDGRCGAAAVLSSHAYHP